MAKKRVARLPCIEDFPLPFDCELPGGVMHVMLPTMRELQAFWAVNSDKYGFAASSCLYQEDSGNAWAVLAPGEWVFGPTPESLAAAVWRWDKMGFEPVWHDQRTLEPELYALWHTSELEVRRAQGLREGTWTDEDERWFNSTGWWVLSCPAFGVGPGKDHWFREWDEQHLEWTWDRELPSSEVVRRFQAASFWHHVDAMGGWTNVECFTAHELPGERHSVDDFIAFWSSCQGFTYGCSAEIPARCGTCPDAPDCTMKR